jgi:prevent-host-death family protein
MTMKKVNIHEAKARLSEFVEAVERGERIVICRRNRPVAEIVRAVPVRTSARPVGTARGLLQVPPAFFDPLPDDVVAGFYPGEGVPGGEVAPMVADGPADGAWDRPRAKKGTRG